MQLSSFKMILIVFFFSGQQTHRKACVLISLFSHLSPSSSLFTHTHIQTVLILYLSVKYPLSPPLLRCLCAYQVMPFLTHYNTFQLFLDIVILKIRKDVTFVSNRRIGTDGDTKEIAD